MSDDRETTGATIEDYLLEERTFPPPAGFKEAALVAGTHLYDEADQDYEGFWARQAADLLDWTSDWHTILDWQLPFARWFVGGTLNASYNCLDRHVLAGRGDRVAFHWEGEPGDVRTITYAELLADVERFANVLKDLGVAKGDRVAIYLPMIPELPVAVLACARIGAAHSVVFGGFSADSLADRINDAECKVLVTADGGWRRGKPGLLKPTADVAVAHTPSIEHVVVVDRIASSGGDRHRVVDAPTRVGARRADFRTGSARAQRARGGAERPRGDAADRHPRPSVRARLLSSCGHPRPRCDRCRRADQGAALRCRAPRPPSSGAPVRLRPRSNGSLARRVGGGSSPSRCERAWPPTSGPATIRCRQRARPCRDRQRRAVTG